MTRPREYGRLLDSLRAHNRLIGRSSEGAHAVELDGVLATVCPRVPERSYPNSVVYESARALIGAIPISRACTGKRGSGRGRCGFPRRTPTPPRRSRTPAIALTPIPPR